MNIVPAHLPTGELYYFPNRISALANSSNAALNCSSSSNDIDAEERNQLHCDVGLLTLNK
jgi:hypothetical protein